MKSILTVFVCLLLTGTIFGQSPNSIKYQAVLRDTRGNIKANISTNILIDILKGSAKGSVVFSENHQTTTDGFGLINLEIGLGNPVKGSIAEIDWGNGTYYIRVTVDGVEMGTGQLLSVPYALHATTADKLTNGSRGITAEVDPIFTAWDKSSGIAINAAQVKDFQESVSNIPSVIANNLKISYPVADATKLAGIAAGAEVNVNADWNAASGDALILNKPFIPKSTNDLINNAGFITSLTGVITSTGNETHVSSQTGTGSSFVMSVSPTLVTPALGVATANSINGLIPTAAATGFTISGGTVSEKLTVTADATLSGINTGDNSPNSLYSDLVTNATHTGDVTGATALTISNDAVTTPKILNSNVTYAKIQNVSGSDKVLGRISPGAGNLEEIGTTGSGNVVRATSPTLVTPDLGTPSAEVGTNITGTAAGLTAGHVLTNADLTGEVTSTGNVTTVTNSAVIGKVLTGYSSGAGTITASDNILQAIQKLDGNKGWSLQGNSATDASNFLGTSDDKPLQFRVNNVQSGLINKTDETTFLGYEAGLANTGTGNLAVGFQALKSNTTAQQNTAIGYQALYNNNSNGQNTAVGYQALYNNTMGYNTAIGIQALYSNVSGFYNTAIGQNALYFNDSGFSNVALGMGSLQANTTGYRNIGIGRYALAGNGAGSDNIAMGYFASASAGGGTDNFAVGYQSLMVNTGSRNTGIGHQVLVNNTGSDNLAIGYQSLFSNTSGGKNTAIGNYAGYYNTGSNRLYFDSFDRGSSAGDDAGAIIQGTMDATPSNQLLVLNASTTVRGALKVSGSNISANPTSERVDGILLNAAMGNLMLRTTMPNDIGLSANSGTHFQFFTDDSSNRISAGSITSSGSATSFNTTSDYRLKQDFKSFSGLSLIRKIKIYDYQWIADKTRMYGVKAHELQEVLPYAVTGAKDAIDKEGKPVYQSVDYSKIVPVLVKGMQELQTTIETQQKQIEELRTMVELLLKK